MLLYCMMSLFKPPRLSLNWERRKVDKDGGLLLEFVISSTCLPISFNKGIKLGERESRYLNYMAKYISVVQSRTEILQNTKYGNNNNET